MKLGFRWCPHCRTPHALDVRICPKSGRPLDRALHEANRAQHPMVGTLLDGKYNILRLLGSGGAGQVFEAEDVESARLVAIKIVVAEAGDHGFVRLEREAQVLHAIAHPNICDVVGFGRSTDGRPYVVLDRLFGETLAMAMKRAGQLSVRAAIQIFSQVLSGLQAAHARNIIHRDLKPQNIFLVDRLGSYPLVKIVDFGLAQDLSAKGTRITRPGNICGTIQYMSPEQLRGKMLDHRSDLFAVGIMIHEALTGRHPFAAASAVELQMKIMDGVVRPLREVRGDVPGDLDTIVMSTLSVARDARPTSALVLRNALEAIGARLAAAPGEQQEDQEPASTTEPGWQPPSSSNA